MRLATVDDMHCRTCNPSMVVDLTESDFLDENGERRAAISKLEIAM